jgi:hypothetical protein
VAANLRHHDIEPWFNAETIGGPLPDQPFLGDELLTCVASPTPAKAGAASLRQPGCQ